MKRIGQFAKKRRLESSTPTSYYLGRKGSRVRRFRSSLSAMRKFRAGYNRTSGFYGRFSGPQGEDKFFDTANNFDFDLTGEVPATGQLVLIPQGITESTRIGRKCTITRITIRGVLTFIPAALAQACTVCYLYLLQDTQCNGAAAAITDVFTSAEMHRNHMNLANSQRFKILKKWVWVFNVGSGVTTAYNNVVRVIDYSRKCRIPLEFSSTSGAIAELKSNNIFFIAGTDGNSDDHVDFSANTRVRFSDH